MNELQLVSKGWHSHPKGFPSAKPHPKAQEVHSLAPSQNESISQDSDRLGGWWWCSHREDGGGEGNAQGRKWPQRGG